MFYMTSPRLTFQDYTYQKLDFIHQMLASPAMMKHIGNGGTKTLPMQFEEGRFINEQLVHIYSDITSIKM